MSVVKIQIQKDFVVLYNKVLENPNLSFKAKGLWAYCMGRPNDWEFHVSHLATVSKDGRDSIYSCLKELEAEGLVVKVQDREAGKFGKFDYIIYPYPQEIQKILPLTAFPDTAKPDTANPPLPSIHSLPSIEKNQSSSCSPPFLELNKEMVMTRISCTEEEFEEARKKYERLDPGKIPHPIAWFEKVIDNYRKEKFIEMNALSAKHRKMAEFYEHKFPKSRNSETFVLCLSEAVELHAKGGLIMCPFACSDEEWEKQTGWKNDV